MFRIVDSARVSLPQIESRRRQALAGFERALALNCGVIRPTYLPLEASLRILAGVVGAGLGQHASGRLPRLMMAELLGRAQGCFADEPCLAFLYNSDFTGGIEMRLATFWTKALDLLDFDGNLVLAAAPDGSQGVVLDVDPGPLAGAGCFGGSYELFAWGDRWAARVPAFGAEALAA